MFHALNLSGLRSDGLLEGIHTVCNAAFDEFVPISEKFNYCQSYGVVFRCDVKESDKDYCAIRPYTNHHSNGEFFSKITEPCIVAFNRVFLFNTNVCRGMEPRSIDKRPIATQFFYFDPNTAPALFFRPVVFGHNGGRVVPYYYDGNYGTDRVFSDKVENNQKEIKWHCSVSRCKNCMKSSCSDATAQYDYEGKKLSASVDPKVFEKMVMMTYDVNSDSRFSEVEVKNAPKWILPKSRIERNGPDSYVVAFKENSIYVSSDELRSTFSACSHKSIFLVDISRLIAKCPDYTDIDNERCMTVYAQKAGPNGRIFKIDTKVKVEVLLENGVFDLTGLRYEPITVAPTVVAMNSTHDRAFRQTQFFHNKKCEKDEVPEICVERCFCTKINHDDFSKGLNSLPFNTWNDGVADYGWELIYDIDFESVCLYMRAVEPEFFRWISIMFNDDRETVRIMTDEFQCIMFAAYNSFKGEHKTYERLPSKHATICAIAEQAIHLYDGVIKASEWADHSREHLSSASTLTKIKSSLLTCLFTQWDPRSFLQNLKPNFMAGYNFVKTGDADVCKYKIPVQTRTFMQGCSMHDPISLIHYAIFHVLVAKRRNIEISELKSTHPDFVTRILEGMDVLKYCGRDQQENVTKDILESVFVKLRKYIVSNDMEKFIYIRELLPILRLGYHELPKIEAKLHELNMQQNVWTKQISYPFNGLFCTNYERPLRLHDCMSDRLSDSCEIIALKKIRQLSLYGQQDN